jgi:hypothetical protein
MVRSRKSYTLGAWSRMRSVFGTFVFPLKPSG